jgi:hypothetical protein
MMLLLAAPLGVGRSIFNLLVDENDDFALRAADEDDGLRDPSLLGEKE